MLLCVDIIDFGVAVWIEGVAVWIEGVVIDDGLVFIVLFLYIMTIPILNGIYGL